MKSLVIHLSNRNWKWRDKSTTSYAMLTLKVILRNLSEVILEDVVAFVFLSFVIRFVYLTGFSEQSHKLLVGLDLNCTQHLGRF